MKPSVRITSDGTVRDVSIKTADGSDLENVASAAIWLEPNEPPRLDLEVLFPAFDITSEVRTVEVRCPCCGKTVARHACGDIGEDEDSDRDMPF